MEFDFVRERVERIEWAVRRVAAAFGVNEWEPSPLQEGYYPLYCGINASGERVYWKINEETFQVILLQIGEQDAGCGLRYEINAHAESAPSWECFPHPQHNRLMARGLYRLGFEDECVLAQLNSPLSMHEKLELRISPPREFWPRTWLDEEGE